MQEVLKEEVQKFDKEQDTEFDEWMWEESTKRERTYGSREGQIMP